MRVGPMYNCTVHFAFSGRRGSLSTHPLIGLLWRVVKPISRRSQRLNLGESSFVTPASLPNQKLHRTLDADARPRPQAGIGVKRR